MVGNAVDLDVERLAEIRHESPGARRAFHRPPGRASGNEIPGAVRLRLFPEHCATLSAEPEPRSRDGRTGLVTNAASDGARVDQTEVTDIVLACMQAGLGIGLLSIEADLY